MMRKLLLWPALMMLCGLLASCSTIVADRIAQQQSYDYAWFISDQELQRRGFNKQRYCSVQAGRCVSYLEASPITDAKFAFQMMVNQDPIQLQLSRRDLPEAFEGTVVLLHGFGISKEYMAMTASYFRFLGFRVIVPDMLGHGESDGAKGYGWQDARLINEMLDHGPQLAKPLLVFGNSMGAIAAGHLAAQRNDIAALVLQAPMLPFDVAAYNYIAYDAPLLARLVTERSIRKGAVKALDEQAVPLAQTDLKPTLAELEVPVLILASSADTVSPYSYFKPLENDQVSVAEISQRNHYSMVVIDQEDHQYILRWLQQHFGQQESP